MIWGERNLKIQLVVLFTNPSARAGYDTRSIFKRSLTGLNSEFSFSQTSCLNKAEEPSLSYYLPWRENKGVHTFPKGICPKVNIIARLEYELAYYDFAVHRFNHYTTRTPKIQLVVKHETEKTAYMYSVIKMKSGVQFRFLLRVWTFACYQQPQDRRGSIQRGSVDR